jgi:hypothetical protein
VTDRPFDANLDGMLLVPARRCAGSLHLVRSPSRARRDEQETRLTPEGTLDHTSLAICLGLEFIVWFVPNLIANAVVVCIMGVLLGPIYPLCMNWYVPKGVFTISDIVKTRPPADKPPRWRPGAAKTFPPPSSLE